MGSLPLWSHSSQTEIAEEKARGERRAAEAEERRLSGNLTPLPPAPDPSNGA